MLCYRDRSYCSLSANLNGSCINTKCPRLFTDKDVEGSIEWMGEHAPIAMINFKTRDCGYETSTGLDT